MALELERYDCTRQLWEVVGGLDRGGLVVRREAQTTSSTLPYRLSHGSWVQELERRGERLHYQRLTGEGPDIGWVSVEAKARGEPKVFLEPRNGPPPGWKSPLPLGPAPAPGPVPSARLPSAPTLPSWTSNAALLENLPAGGPIMGLTAPGMVTGSGQLQGGLLQGIPLQKANGGPPNYGGPQYGAWQTGRAQNAGPLKGINGVGGKQAGGSLRPAKTAQAFGAPHAIAIAGAIRETDYEVDFEVVHEKVMVRRSPSTKDALLGVIKEGALLRGTPYDVSGDPWLLLAMGTCDELNLHLKQGWVLINGKSVGLGELLRETHRRGEAAGGDGDLEAAQDLLEKEARSRRIGGGRIAAPALEPSEVSMNDGEGAGEPAKPDLISVAFWGICDIKYDPRRPKHHRVKVLELGDGKISRFSHHGRRILERYKSGFCMDEVPIKRSVMVENKKFTHDVFVREGFQHLRPNTTSYERKYEPGLADRILANLGILAADKSIVKGKAVVLKLCNRSRGAGVCVVTPGEIDQVLKQLLSPPEGDDLEAWLKDRAPTALSHQFRSQFEETCLHWWSNECPIFVAEECCQSEPVAMEQGGSERFDGTLRVAFALHRGAKTHKWEGARSIKPFDIDWLGGYWKLPRVASVHEGAAETKPGSEGMEALHDRIVSSFNSREKRTAEVADAHLQEVYDALTPALPRIFQTGSLGVQQIQDAYANNTLFRAFALSRAAAQMRAKEMPKALNLYRRSREMIQSEVAAQTGTSDMPRCSTLSYVERNLGVCHAMQGDWNAAAGCFRMALRLMPTNATALYLQGCYQQESGMLDASATSLLRCLALDPDFKLPYVALGTTRLLQGRFQEAAETARACLVRHPDAPVASFTLGQAIYHCLWDKQEAVSKAAKAQQVASWPPTPEWSEADVDPALIDEGKNALSTAKQREPKQWTSADEAMLQYLFSEASERMALQRQPVHPWRSIGWRP